MFPMLFFPYFISDKTPLFPLPDKLTTEEAPFDQVVERLEEERPRLVGDTRLPTGGEENFYS